LNELGALKAALVDLKDYVPFFSTLVQYIFALILVLVFKNKLFEIVDACKKRIEDGSKVNLGGLEIGEAPYVDSRGEPKSSLITTQEEDQASNSGLTEEKRKSIYQENQGYFLTHTLYPSSNVGLEFDIFIYLIKHEKGKVGKTSNLPEIENAEFFFGTEWHSRIFKIDNRGGKVGISTSAFAPFLALCRVTLRDGSQIFLSRYIDFEMGHVLEALASEN
jgi:hypothetical protein